MAKIVIISDLHLSPLQPVLRTDPWDNFCDASISQLRKILEEGDVLVICGDVFDRPRDIDALSALMTFKQSMDISILAVRGQHDMSFHSRTTVSCFDLAVSAGVIEDLGDSPRLLGYYVLYGAGWGQDVPIAGHKPPTNILIAHKTLWHKKPIYPGQTEGNVKEFAEQVKNFEYVFTGDNHVRFEYKNIYNLGAFTRRSFSLHDQPPAFASFDNGVFNIEVVEDGAEWDFEKAALRNERASVRSEFADNLATLKTHDGEACNDNFRSLILEQMESETEHVRDRLNQILEII